MHDGDGQGNNSGGDWQGAGGANQQGGGQADYQSGVDGFESPSVPEDDGHPLADNKFNVTAFADVLQLTFNRLKDGPVLIALVGLAAISLVWSVFTGGIQFVVHLATGGAGTGIVGMLLGLVGFLLWPLMFVVAVAQWSLYRPAARSLFEGSIEVSSPVDVIKSVTGVMLPVGLTMLGYFVATSLGVLCFFVGSLIAAILFVQAPYLTAVHDRGLVDAFKESASRGLEHWHILAMAIGATFVVVAASGMIYGCVGTVFGYMGSIHMLVNPVLQWLATTLVFVFAFVLHVAAFATIDELEGIATIQK